MFSPELPRHRLNGKYNLTSMCPRAGLDASLLQLVTEWRGSLKSARVDSYWTVVRGGDSALAVRRMST